MNCAHEERERIRIFGILDCGCGHDMAIQCVISNTPHQYEM